MVLAGDRGRGGPPATLVAPAHEVLRQRDLAEVRAVVVAHRGSTVRVASMASRAISVGSRFHVFSLGASYEAKPP